MMTRAEQREYQRVMSELTVTRQQRDKHWRRITELEDELRIVRRRCQMLLVAVALLVVSTPLTLCLAMIFRGVSASAE